MYKKFFRISTALASVPLLGMIFYVTQAICMELSDGKTLNLCYRPNKSYLYPDTGPLNPNLPSASPRLMLGHEWKIEWDEKKQAAKIRNRDTLKYLIARADGNVVTNYGHGINDGLWFMNPGRETGRIHNTAFGTKYSLDASEPSDHGQFEKYYVRLKQTSNDPDGQSWTLIPEDDTDNSCTIN